MRGCAMRLLGEVFDVKRRTDPDTERSDADFLDARIEDVGPVIGTLQQRGVGMRFVFIECDVLGSDAPVKTDGVEPIGQRRAVRREVAEEAAACHVLGVQEGGLRQKPVNGHGGQALLSAGLVDVRDELLLLGQPDDDRLGLNDHQRLVQGLGLGLCGSDKRESGEET